MTKTHHIGTQLIQTTSVVNKPHPFALKEEIFNMMRMDAGDPNDYEWTDTDIYKHLLAHEYDKTVQIINDAESPLASIDKLELSGLVRWIDFIEIQYGVAGEEADRKPTSYLFKNGPSESEIMLIKGLISETYRMEFNLDGGRLLETTEHLEKALNLTDIAVGRDMPSSHLKIPYDRIYISFAGGKMGVILREDDNREYNLYINGAYLEETVSEAGYPAIKITLTCRPDVVNGITSVFNYMDLRLDENITIEQSLAEVIKSASSSLGDNLYGVEAVKEAVYHIVKILLYMNSQDNRREVCPNKTAMIARLKGLGTKKKIKMGVKLERLYDFIKIGPVESLEPKDVNGEHSNKASHWRRGHFANQPCGEGRLERKLIWRKPALINSEHLAPGEEVPLKHFKIAA